MHARTRFVRLMAGAAILISSVACGSTPDPAPRAGFTRGGVPPLRGANVMLLPTQDNLGVPGDVDAELEFALKGREGGVEWHFPEELDRVMRRTPTLNVNIYRLATDVFMAGEIDRIGDPLFRDLLRLSALTGSELALIPVQVRYREETEEREAALELVAVMVEVNSGMVLWNSILEGSSGRMDDPAALATLADRFARTVVR